MTDTSTEYPYAYDIAAIFIAVQTGPIAPYAIATALALTVARRSSTVIGAVLDMVAQLTGSVEVPDSPLVRKLLPGIERLEKSPTRAALSPPVTHTATPDMVETHHKTVRLDDIQCDDNILVVGPKGSGKTTLLTQMITARHGAHIALDPHCTPGKWPCGTVGGGLEYDAIQTVLDSAYSQMRKRYKAMATGAVSEAQCRTKAYTMVGDEYRSISRALPGTKDAMGAAEILQDILTQGRKAGMFTLIAAHADTVKALGFEGEGDLRMSFDWIIYLGALAVRKVSDAAQQQRPAVAYHCERDVYLLLDVPAVKRSQDVYTPTHTRQADTTPNDTQMLETFLTGVHQRNDVPDDGNEKNDVPDFVPALESHGTVLNTTVPRSVPDVSPEETARIMHELGTGTAPSAIAKKLPGYDADRYKEFKAKVDYVKKILDTLNTGATQ